MEIYAKFRLKADVDPIDFIETMIEKEIGWGNWVREKDGKYYLGWEQSAGAHSYDEEKEIPKERYDYVRHLQAVLTYLKEKRDKK